MIYVCIPSYNEASTVGLLLWKIRQVFAGFPREYQLLLLDDGSTDATSDVLEPYARVLPLTLLRHETRQGYAASVEELLRKAVELTDRPKRDAAIVMHADFAHNPQAIPDLVRRIESGADVVVAEGRVAGQHSRPHRMLRRFAPLFLRGIVTVPGVSDLVSGYAIFRLVALRNALRSQNGALLVTVLAGRTIRSTSRSHSGDRAPRPSGPPHSAATMGGGHGTLASPAFAQRCAHTPGNRRCLRPA
jgi:glycosyltransferase involved in cell wall biosynthesis